VAGAIRRIPTLCIHYAPEMQGKEIVSSIYDDLIHSGLPHKNVFLNKTAEESSCTPLSRSSSSDRIEHARTAEWIILIGSPELKEQYDNRKITRINVGVISSEIDMIRVRDVLEGNGKIVLIYQGGSQSSTFPSSLQHLKALLFGEDYHLEFLSLLKDMLVAEQEDLKEGSLESNLYRKHQAEL
jgi:hypothetical protein